MNRKSQPEKPDLPFVWNGGPDVMSDPALFDGIIFRRVAAYLIDAAILAGAAVFLWFVVILSLGLLGPVAALITTAMPVAYHSLLIAGPNSATVGMRLLGIEVRRLDGGRPDLVHALIQTLLFYATLATGVVLLIAAFFNDRRRCLHDWLAGTVTVNAPAAARG